MSLVQITGPAVEPVTVAEAKVHCAVSRSDHDALIGSLIAAARRACESRVGRSFITTTWELRLGRFPVADIIPPRAWSLERPISVAPILLPRANVLAVQSVSYLDSTGTSTVLDPSLYAVALGPPAGIVPAYGLAWPSHRVLPESVKVRFTAGYGATAADVPDTVKAAIKLWVGHLYENPQAVVTGTIATELPLAVEALLAAEDWGSYA